MVYFVGRVLVQGSRETAMNNAERLLSVEARLGIDIESALQTWVLEHSLVESLVNLSYVWLHWPLLLVAFWFVHRWSPDAYRRYRNAVFVSGAVGLILFAIFPMAPPRFMPGFVGTVSDAARLHYLPYPLEWTNRYAAFPSYHVGWTLVACLAVRSTLSSLLARRLVLVPAVLVAFAVVATANHYVIDAVVGGVLALAPYVALGRLGRSSSGSTPAAAATTPSHAVLQR